MIKMKRSCMTETPAPNERFGATAAVAPLKVTCELGSYYPAGSSVKPLPRKAAGTEQLLLQLVLVLELQVGLQQTISAKPRQNPSKQHKFR